MMNPTAINANDLRYNPVDGCFEALVTLDDAVSYACTVPGPMSMSPEMAARALYHTALRQHSANTGLRSTRQPIQQMRAAPRPVGWLQRLGLARAA